LPFSSATYITMHYIVYVATIVSICWYFFRQNRKRQLLNKFTEPPGHFLFGHVLKIRSTTSTYPSIILSFTVILSALISTSKKFLKDHGTTLKLNVGPLFSVLLTCDYKLIEYVLKHPGEFKKSDNYEFLKPWLGSGLLTSESIKRTANCSSFKYIFQVIRGNAIERC
jgi:cytochrome P450 family 4